jgi:stress-induced-phosphoprotein 1
VELKPDWAKGYSRLGAALHGLRSYDEASATAHPNAHHVAHPACAAQALTAYKKGLEIDPGNEQLKSGLADVEEAQARADLRCSAEPPRLADGLGWRRRCRKAQAALTASATCSRRPTR